MFNKIKKTTIVLIAILLGSTSCAHSNGNQRLEPEVLPRRAFVHLEKTLTVRSCTPTQCLSMNFRSAASGFIINKQEEGSFVITAAHFCEDAQFPGENTTVTAKYKVKRLDGTEFTGVSLHYQRDIDVCLMYAADLTEGVQAVKISPVEPEPGEKIFNIGAPLSIVGPDMVPILEGRFSGHLGQNAFYTLPAAPGSSGSMILNERGELIGLVHSVFLRFHVISLSTKYEDLKGFIDEYLYKYILYKSVMGELQLDNIFSVKS